MHPELASVELDEVNVTRSNEDAEELTELDSDGENGDGLDDSAGEEFELLSDNGVDDDDIVIQPDMLFDEAILAAVEGVEALGTIEKPVLDEMANDGWTDPTKCTPYPYMKTSYELPESKAVFDEYPRLYEGPFGPTNEAKTAARSPSGAFFMTHRLWDDIAQGSNEYFLEKLEERVENQYQKQVARELKKAGYCRETKDEIRRKIEKLPDITARNLCVIVGLLIARTLAPNQEKLQNHWKQQIKAPFHVDIMAASCQGTGLPMFPVI
ncbi:LOW QUALITY PROTEIN: hypothetical protein PHMEG_0007078 [Phytophthora megakarya]|uniref:PiggyBac transposable element-derived protein domain-containing protein n=1 Tax=Phytophthora megakarya TaxID=4795 RepID=A0A225WP88_9STRA|nr:LOW QUALITY PROTEIN: hypothetical protein PHMEG_0007078 [Phytophthora megakarya]